MSGLFQDGISPRAKFGAAALIAAALVGFSAVVEVPESQQAVVMWLGDPVRVINRYKPGVDFGNTGAGLSCVPFFETLVRVDRRVLNLDMERQQVNSSDQQRLEVDAYARFRIIDPVKMVRTAGTAERVQEQLQPIMTSVLRQGLASYVPSLLTPERGVMMEQIRKALDLEAREYGAQIIDVRIKRADLPDGTPLERAYARMEAAREQEATTIRAMGQKQAQIIRAEAEALLPRPMPKPMARTPPSMTFIARWRAIAPHSPIRPTIVNHDRVDAG
jgi:membrane protease subunit HflC